MILKVYLYQSRIILHFNFEMNWLILGKICLFKEKYINCSVLGGRGTKGGDFFGH